MNIFERAVREKTRFAFKGSIGVEELWDLSLTNLDTIYGNLETELEGLPKKSLLSTNSKQREEIEFKQEIIKHIVETKKAEAEQKSIAKENSAKKQMILDILAKDWNEDLPESLRITKLLMELDNTTSIDIDDNTPLKPIPDHVLSYYYPYVNDMFKNDGISYEIQRLFEIGYDDQTNRITIPIRDELNNLVGVKGRLFKKELEEDDLKYLYIESCNRSKVLYGLNVALPHIQQKGFVYVTESEKGVLQLWSMGIYNCVATGGKKVSQHQIDMLSRLCVDIIFCFDKDVEQIELEELADRFIESVNIYAIIDKNNILEEKESPSDNPDKFVELERNNKYKIK